MKYFKWWTVEGTHEKKNFRIFIAIYIYILPVAAFTHSRFFVRSREIFCAVIKIFLCYFQRFGFFRFLLFLPVLCSLWMAVGVSTLKASLRFSSTDFFHHFLCLSFIFFSLPLACAVFLCSSFFSHFSQFHLIWCDFCQANATSKLWKKMRMNCHWDAKRDIWVEKKSSNGKVSQLIVIETQIKGQFCVRIEDHADGQEGAKRTDNKF